MFPSIFRGERRSRSRSLRRRVRFANRYMTFILRLLNRTRVLGYVEQDGAELIPADGGVLLGGNHPSVLGPIILRGIIDRDLTFLAKRPLFRWPVVGPLLRWFGMIPVRRNTPRARQASADGVQALRDGAMVAVYPEGGVYKTLAPFKNGFAYMVQETGAPAFLVAEVGTSEIFADSRWRPRLGCRVLVVIRPFKMPALLHTSPADDRAVITQAAYDQLAAMVAEAERELARRKRADRRG